jgi:hypothetical protein
MKPTKVLSCNLYSLTPTEYITENDITWVSHNQPYRWTATINVNQQPHSWAGSTTPYFYNGLDILVGDFVVTKGQARILKIIEISNQTDQTITCVLEDDDRLNVYIDPFQIADGSILTGDGFVFSVVNGMPALFPLPEATPDFLDEYVSQIISRFAYQQKNKTIEINQIGHGFVVNDLITLNSTGDYTPASYTQDSYESIIGIVTESEDTDNFKYQPIGQFININLPGAPGTVQYLDPANPGKVSEVIDDIFPFYPALIKIDNDTAVFATLNFNHSTAKLEITSDLINWAKVETIMLTAETADATPTILTLDGANVSLEDNSFYSFTLDLIAADTQGNAGLHKQLQGTLKIKAGAINLEGDAAETIFNDMLTGNQVSVAVSQPNILQFIVIGQPTTGIRWNSRLDLTKVTAL